jgi:radical SAM superfamily enzyme YgiQ (UPF0313 family)
MKVFLIYVRDEDFYQLLPPKLGGSRFGKGRVQVMAFPAIGIETLAPVVRQRGHEVRMFDTCHPRMKAEHIAEAVVEERPDVIALSFLSTTSYPATRSMARQLKRAAPSTPIILGGVFATINAKEILANCPYVDCVGKGEGEELLPDFLENLDNPGEVGGLVWRSGGEIVENAPCPIIKDLDQFPIMVRANCSFLAFGIEAGTQKVLNRLKKKQTIEQIEHAVSKAKRQGIDTAHGFFLIGSPEETEADIMESFRFAARLELDTFGFNRLCAYRGTPLWQEYIGREIIDDTRDWYKWFKCSDIDPTVLPSKVVNRTRQKGYLLLFAHRLFLRPVQTIKLLRRFGRHMETVDILKLLWSPFRRRTLTLEPELPTPTINKGQRTTHPH